MNKLKICFLLIIFFLTSINYAFSKVTDVLIHLNSETIQNNKKPVDIVFYFPGLGNNESLILMKYELGGLDIYEHKEAYRKDIVFVGFRTTPWSTPSTVNELIKNMKLITNNYNTRKIYLIGVSLGASLALNTLALMDNELESKTVGVLACFPVTDYEYTLNNTKRKNVETAIKNMFYKFKDPRKAMKLASPINYISMIHEDKQIVLIEGTIDSHVPSPQIENYYRKLRTKVRNVKLIKLKTDHDFKEFSEEFKKEVLGFIK